MSAVFAVSDFFFDDAAEVGLAGFFTAETVAVGFLSGFFVGVAEGSPVGTGLSSSLASRMVIMMVSLLVSSAALTAVRVMVPAFFAVKSG